MFIPIRRDGKLFRAGKKNVYGDRQYSEKPEVFGWGPIYLRDTLQDSGVRADSSASRGRSDERVADARIVMDKRVKPSKGDKIVLGDDEPLYVLTVQERMDITGRLHHWEVDCGTAQTS